MDGSDSKGSPRPLAQLYMMEPRKPTLDERLSLPLALSNEVIFSVSIAMLLPRLSTLSLRQRGAAWRRYALRVRND